MFYLFTNYVAYDKFVYFYTILGSGRFHKIFLFTVRQQETWKQTRKFAIWK